MLKHASSLALTLFVLFAPAACVGTDDSDSTSRAIIDTPCAEDVDCPAGFECEVEVEHGTTTSFCQAHESADDPAGACPSGYELEIEHGQAFCKPHGGDDGVGDDSGGGTDDPPGDDNGGGGADDPPGDDNGGA